MTPDHPGLRPDLHPDRRRVFPASFVLRAVSRLVPRMRRAEWLAEWHAEVAHAWARRGEGGESAAALRLRLTVRVALGATFDALWLRRKQRSGAGWRWAFRDATRSLRRRPGFAWAVIGTLALGMGSATAVFSVVDGLMLRPLPFREPDRLVSVTGTGGGRVVDLEALRVWGERADVFEGVWAHGGGSFILTGAGEARSYRAETVEPGFLEMLGVRPSLGRTFAEDEAVPGNHRVVLLTDEVWREAFGADRDVVGRSVELDGEPYTVVGVLPPTLRRLPGGVVHLVVPLTDPPPWGSQQALGLGRLRPGLTLETARARLQQMAGVLARERPREGGWEVGLSPVSRSLGAERERGFYALAGAALCLLLIACANAAGLLVLRGISRRPELALRVALGGSRASLVRRVLAEGMVLAGLAGVLGTLLAWAGVRGLLTLLPSNLLRFSYTTVGVDGRVLAFAAGLTVLTGLLFGILPALGAGAAGSARAGQATTSSRRDVRLRAAIQVAQLAVAVVLLSGAALFGRSFLTLTSVPVGFDVDRLLRLDLVSLERLRDDPDGAAAFARTLDARLRSLPGVAGVTRSGGTWLHFDHMLEPEGGEARDVASFPSLGVDTAYFRVMGITIVEGRGLRAEDARENTPGVVVDEDLARALWPDGSAVGRRFRVDEEPWRTVVGVSEDVKTEGPHDPFGRFVVFRPRSLEELRSSAVWIRTAGEPAALGPAVRALVRELDPEQPIASLETGREVLGETVAHPRFLTAVLTVFAVVAVALAAVGVYGLVSFTVARRTREIGVRMALGAGRRTLVGGVLGRGLILAGLGLAFGLAGAVALARFVRALLFGVSPLDPWALGTAMLALLACCVLALVGPARRAASVDPSEALRAE